MTSTAAEEVADRSLDEQIGANVHQLMWQKRITQTAMAPRMSLTQSVLGRKIRGQVTWTARDLANAARILGVSIDDLVWAPWGSNPQPAD